MLKSILISLVALQLSACGFQLRSQPELPPQLNPIFVATDLNDPFLTNGIQTALRKAKLTLAKTVKEAPYHIQILDKKLQRQFVNLSSNTQTRSYQLTLRVHYAVLDKNNKPLLPTQTVISHRPWLYNFNQVLGSSSEGDTIVKEMYPDISKQIVLRLAADDTKQALAKHQS